MTRHFWRSFRKDTSGATAALYALALPALIAVVGIGFDYAHIASLDTELQNAADEAALAGATQLDEGSGAMSRAVAAAQGKLVTNFTLFANDASSTSYVTNARAVGVPSNTVYFYATLADAEANTNALDQSVSGNDAKARFIRVAVETRTADYALTPVVGILKGSVQDAQAVAGIGSATCRTPPLMICNPDEDTSVPGGGTFDANAHKGDGLLVEQGGGGMWGPGNFGYLNVGLGTGANAVKEGLGQNYNPGDCIATYGGVTTIDTQTGNMASAPDALNTRFDIYNSNSCVGSGDCSPSINSRKDLVRSSDATSCTIGSKGWQLPAKPYAPTSATTPLTPTQDAQIDSMGFPRDMCHAISTSGSCPNGPVGNGDWDRDAYFYVNYVRADGTHWSHASWIADTGLSSTATRYQVYDWEIAHRGDLIDGVKILAPRPLSSATPALTNYGEPVCSSSQGYGGGIVPTSVEADRRVLSVAVVNCETNSVSGSSKGVPVAGWMNVFLVQPSLNRGIGGTQLTRQDQIYVEIIGKTVPVGNGSLAGTVIRRDVPYLIK